MIRRKLPEKRRKRDTNKANNIKKKLAILGLSLAILTTNYSGNSFGMKDYIDKKVSSTKDVVVNTFSRNIGINANTLQYRISNSDSIDQYAPELQDLVYTINQNLQETEQQDTIETMINQLSEPAQEEIFLKLYVGLPENSRNGFNELILNQYSGNGNSLPERWNEFRSGTRNLYDTLKDNFGSWFHNE